MAPMQAAFAAQLNKQMKQRPDGDSSELDMKKYERMKKMGMPINSILNRMKMDGATDSQIVAFGGSAAKKAKVVADTKQIMPEKCRPSKKLKPFHWAKINSHQTEKTVWKDADKKMAALCKEIDFSEFDALFSKEAESTHKKAAKKKERNQLIDPKREQNVMIGLAQMKMSEDDLLDAILKMDDKVRSLNIFPIQIPCDFAFCDKMESEIERSNTVQKFISEMMRYTVSDSECCLLFEQNQNEINYIFQSVF